MMPSSDSPLSLSLSVQCQFKVFSYIFTAAALAFGWLGLAVTENIELIKLSFIFFLSPHNTSPWWHLQSGIAISGKRTPDCSAL